MGDLRTEQIFCDAEYFDEDDGNHIKDIIAQTTKNAVSDIAIGGIISQTISPDSPASLELTVASLLGYSTNGEHLKVAVANPKAETFVPTGTLRWYSLFATFSWAYSEERANGIGESEYHARTEDVTLSTERGSPTVLPTNPGGGAIRLCSVRLASTTTQITAGMIKTTGSLGGTNYADWMKTLADKVNKSGDTMTGSLQFNDGNSVKPMLYGASGTFSMPDSHVLLISPGEDDYDKHACMSSGVIDTKITNKNMQVLLNINTGFYAGGQVVDAGWMSPLRMRWHTDLHQAVAAETLSEGIYVHYMETNNVRNGKIQVYIIGAGNYESETVGNFITRFYLKPIEWLAICPMPRSLGY